MNSINDLQRVILQYSSNDPWNNLYGLARSSLAFGTLSTLLFNDVYILFRPASGIAEYPICKGIGEYGLFCLLSSELEIAKWIAIIILLLVIAGYYPKFSGILHWWVTYSYSTSAIIVDEGDQVAVVISLLLIPVTMTDYRRNHWFKSTDSRLTDRFRIKSIVAQSSFLIIRIQVAIIYLNAAVAKAQVAEWMNGTALYYWFIHPMFGVSNSLRQLLFPIITNGFLITIMTWSVICLEFMIFAGLFMDKKYRPILLLISIAFHFLIFIFHGLFSFFFAMSWKFNHFYGASSKRI